MKDIKISDNIEISNRLDEYILKGLEDGIEIKNSINSNNVDSTKNNKIKYLKTAMLVSIVSGATITGVYAVDKVIDYFKYNKDSIYKYEEEKMQQHVQVVDKSKKHDGVEFRLDTVVSDDSYIIVNYTVISDKKISELENGEELQKNVSMANPFVRLLKGNKEVFEGGNMESEATFVSDYELKGMMRFRVGKYDIKDKTVLTVDTWEVFGIEKDWSINFKLDKKSTNKSSHKYNVGKSQTIISDMEHEGNIIEVKNKFTVDNITIAPMGNTITVTEEVDCPEMESLPYIGDRFVLVDEDNNQLDLLVNGVSVPDEPNKPITSTYEFLLSNPNTKYIKVVPYEYENQTSNTLLDLKEINNMPIDFKISKYGDIKIDRFEITEDRIKYSYTKDGIIPYLSDLVFCDENGEPLFFENSFSKKSVDRDNNRVDVIINLETNKDKSIAKKIKKVTLYSDNGLKLMNDNSIKIELKN